VDYTELFILVHRSHPRKGKVGKRSENSAEERILASIKFNAFHLEYSLHKYDILNGLFSAENSPSAAHFDDFLSIFAYLPSVGGSGFCRTKKKIHLRSRA
jgi:hypothetical protein